MTSTATAPRTSSAGPRPGYTRVYNPSETKPVEVHLGGGYYLWQPRKGRFERQRTVEPHKNKYLDKTGHGTIEIETTRIAYTLVCVDDSVRCANYLDVPAEVTEYLATGAGKRLGLLTAYEAGSKTEDQISALERRKAELEAELHAAEEEHKQRLRHMERERMDVVVEARERKRGGKPPEATQPG